MHQTHDRRKHVPKLEKGKRGQDPLMTLPKLIQNIIFIIIIFNQGSSLNLSSDFLISQSLRSIPILLLPE